MIAQNRAGFALNRASSASALNTYCAASHGIAWDILHVIFFVPMGAPSDVIKEDIQARVDTIHKMLGVAKDQAFFRQGHPLLREYYVPSSFHPLCYGRQKGYYHCATYARL